MSEEKIEMNVPEFEHQFFKNLLNGFQSPIGNVAAVTLSKITVDYLREMIGDYNVCALTLATSFVSISIAAEYREAKSGLDLNLREDYLKFCATMYDYMKEAAIYMPPEMKEQVRKNNEERTKRND